MFLKKSFLLLLIICFSISSVSYVHAEDTPKGISLGLSLATAMADEKDVSKGLKKVVNDETSNWMWSLIGGKDALFNEQINDISAVKGKVDEVVGIISSIEKISTAMGEGNYDTAAIEAMDQVVGKVNHPLVTLTWSAVKMTYESHKALESAKAAVQIEVLYNVINKDRKMMGTIDPGSDQPPTIAMDRATTEYFFNKYVMTNDSVRQALKAYVTTVLGEKWPEQSWSEWIGSFRTIGSGLDTAKSDELEKLDTEWRDKGNSWVRRAIIDVNKQVKLAWAQARLRQAQAKFKQFADRVGHFYNGDFEQMLKEYEDIQTYKKELPMYQETLGKSQKARSEIAQKVGGLKPKDLKEAGSLQQAIDGWAGKVYSYSTRASMIREESLAASLLSERQQWQQLSEKIDAFIGNQEGSVISGVESDVKNDLSKNHQDADYKAQSESYKNKYLNEMISKYKVQEYEWGISLGEDEVEGAEGNTIQIPSDSATFKALLLEQCNKGNIDLANTMLGVWLTAAKKHFDEWKVPLGRVYGDIAPFESFLQDHEAVKAEREQVEKTAVAFSKARVELSRSLPNCSENDSVERCSAIISSNIKILNAYDQGSIPIVDARHKAEYKEGAIVGGWADARKQAKEIVDRMLIVANNIYKKNVGEVSQIPEAFSRLASVRKAQYDRFVAVLDPVLEIRDLDGLKKNLNNDYKTASENEYTFFKPIRSENPQVASLPKVLNAAADNISRGANISDYATLLINAEKRDRMWMDRIDLWKQTDRLSSEDINQIKVLLKVERDFEKDIALADEIADAVPAAIANEKKHYKKMIPLAQRDGFNRAQDSGWLIDNARDVQRFINELIQKKWMRIGQVNELEVNLPGEIQDGMVLVSEPFKHYMTKEELDKFMQPIKAYVNASKTTAFMKTNAPDHYKKLQEILGLPGIQPAKGENFIVANEVVYAKDIEKAEKLLKKLKFDDKNFNVHMAKIAKWLPLTLNAMTDKQEASYKEQAKLYNMSLEEYYEKVLGKTPSKEDYTFKRMDLNGDGLDQHKWGQKYLELRKKLKNLFDEQRGAKIIAEQEANRLKAEEESRRILEEQRKAGEAAGEQELDSRDAFSLAGFYGYSIENPRLNSRSLENASGDVILTKGDLSTGKINISARLFTLDKARTMLLSEDGGRTWQEMPLSRDINFDVDPIPNKAYDFILRIKTSDDREPQIRIFNNVNNIIYQNVSFEQLVTEAVKNIAEAYEQTNLNKFSENISRDYLGNKATLEEGVRFDFDMFTNIQLTIYINHIERRGNMYVAETKWDKKQTPRQTGQEQRTSGKTTFMFVLEEGKMLIKNLRGDLIYATLSPEIAQASGKSSSVVDDIRTARDTRNPEQPGAGETEDQGGVTPAGGGGGTTYLTVQNSPVINVPGFPGTGFDFSANAEVLSSSNGGSVMDVDFEGSIIFGIVGFQKVTGHTFNGLTEAPAAGYTTAGISNDGAGTIYAFITKDNYYGKLEILSFADSPGGNLQFKFAVQTDASRDLSTQ